MASTRTSVSGILLMTRPVMSFLLNTLLAWTACRIILVSDPFDTEAHPEVLIYISTGIHASPEVQESLLGAKDTGLHRMERFVKSSSTQQTSSFYSPISRSGVLTFSDMTKKAKFLCKQGSKTGGISPEVIFRRALNIAGCRDDISLEYVLSHPVGPVPSALFHDDGSMRKTTKSELGHKLEADVSKVTELPQHDKTSCVYIRDAMVAIQMMPGDSYSTFDSLASAYQRNLLVEFDKADTVFDVFDRYDNENSVKAGERERMADAGEGSRKYHVMGGRPVPPWKKL